LEESRNIVLVANICTFLNNVIEAPSDDGRQKAIKDELQGKGIVEFVNSVKTKVSEDEYCHNECGF
jgi:hypothetical protein